MHTVVLRAITHEQPRSSLDEVTGELFRRTGTKACTVTVRKALREAGIERLNPCAVLANEPQVYMAPRRRSCAAKSARLRPARWD